MILCTCFSYSYGEIRKGRILWPGKVICLPNLLLVTFVQKVDVNGATDHYAHSSGSVAGDGGGWEGGVIPLVE